MSRPPWSFTPTTTVGLLLVGLASWSIVASLWSSARISRGTAGGEIQQTTATVRELIPAKHADRSGNSSRERLGEIVVELDHEGTLVDVRLPVWSHTPQFPDDEGRARLEQLVRVGMQVDVFFPAELPANRVLDPNQLRYQPDGSDVESWLQRWGCWLGFASLLAALCLFWLDQRLRAAK